MKWILLVLFIQSATSQNSSSLSSTEFISRSACEVAKAWVDSQIARSASDHSSVKTVCVENNH